MNIIQILIRTKSHLDTIRSPRFRDDKIENALNSSIKFIVLNRYEDIKKNEKDKNFQGSQKIRDELYTLVKTFEVSSGFTVSASGDTLVPVSMFPSNYWLMAGGSVNISGNPYQLVPLTYDERAVIEKNPFTRPSIDYPAEVYRIESSEGVEVIFGSTGTVMSGLFYYMSEPVTISLGEEISSGTIPTGKTIICYMEGVINELGAITDSQDPNYDGSYLRITLKPGEEYTTIKQMTIASGIFYQDFVETDLPSILHEEVATRAASELSGNVENYQRVQELDKRIND